MPVQAMQGAKDNCKVQLRYWVTNMQLEVMEIITNLLGSFKDILGLGAARFEKG